VKNLSVVLNVVLLIAVAFLYIDKFSGNGSETSIMSLSDVNADTPGINSGELTIAYINSDTLLAKYAFYDEINELLNQKRTQAQNQFESRARSLQQEIESFQRTVDGMTINQARAKEEELIQKRENLQRLENNLGQELMAEENKLTNELYDVIADYLAIYGKEKGINIILTYTKGSGVIYADEGLDITQDAIKGLNERHAASRPNN
jgi:outer membrane protein